MIALHVVCTSQHALYGMMCTCRERACLKRCAVWLTLHVPMEICVFSCVFGWCITRRYTLLIRIQKRNWLYWLTIAHTLLNTAMYLSCSEKHVQTHIWLVSKHDTLWHGKPNDTAMVFSCFGSMWATDAEAHVYGRCGYCALMLPLHTCTHVMKYPHALITIKLFVFSTHIA